jgi:hypothetical protein
MAQSIGKRGSVVLIRYPFTDLTGEKVRSALVLTPDYLLPRLEDVQIGPRAMAPEPEPGAGDRIARTRLRQGGGPPSLSALSSLRPATEPLYT